MIAGLAAGCLTAHRPVLLVEDVTGQRVLYRGPVTPGDLVVLSYVHSSEHVPVRGTFLVEADGSLRAKETAFAGFGPGLPAPKDGDAFRLADGLIVVPSGGERFVELQVRVAPFTRHRLLTPAGDELDLSGLMHEGGSVRIHVGDGER